jgi:hypothetical protein
MSRFVIAISICVTSMLTSWDSPCSAQWTPVNVPDFQHGRLVIAPYFINPDTGFIWQLQTTNYFYKTTDGGAKWSQLFSLPQVINQLYFSSETRGYAACMDGLYRTTNEGATWTKIYGSIVPVDFVSVYAVDSAIFGLSVNSYLIYSLNDGKNWDTISTVRFGSSVTGNKEDFVYTKSNGQLLYSSDRGKTWNTESIAGPGGRVSWMPLFSFPFCDEVIDSYDAGSDQYGFDGSSRPFRTWTNFFVYETGAWIAGNMCVAYLSEADSASGLFRSTDLGRTWQMLKGPDFTEIDDFDWRNLSVVGHGAVVYACDITGKLYKTTNGGDGTIQDQTNSFSYSFSRPFTSVDTVRIACDTGIIRFINTSPCDYFAMRGPVIEGLDPKEYSIYRSPRQLCSTGSDTISIVISPLKEGLRSAKFHLTFESSEPQTRETIVPINFYATKLLDLTVFPRIGACSSAVSIFTFCSSRLEIDRLELKGDTQYFKIDTSTLTKDSLHHSTGYVSIVLQPHKHSGLFSGTLHIYGKNHLDNEVQFIDTTLSFSDLVIAEMPKVFPGSKFVDLGTLSTCGKGIDTVFRITNMSCGPDSIIAVDPTTGGFSIFVDSLPTVLQPDSSIEVHIHFVPNDSGFFLAGSAIHVSSMGQTQRIDIALSAQAVREGGILAVPTTTFSAGNFPYCTGDTAFSNFISNIGCDTLVITNIRFANDGTFALASQPSDSLLKPQDTAWFGFRFAPRVKGPHAATLSFHSRNLHGGDAGHNTTITLMGSGTGGYKALAASTDRMELGELYMCQARDTVVWLHNTGCDTLQLDSAIIEGSGGRDAALHAISLPPDSVVPVRLKYRPDTAGHPTTANGVMTFYSNSDSVKIIRVPFTASIIYPGALFVKLSEPQSAKFGKSVTYAVILKDEGGAVAGGRHAVTSLSFDLTHNEDLLSYVSASGLTVGAGAGTAPLQVQHCTISPLPLNDTLGTITFVPYISDSESTPLTISNVRFDNALGVSSDCIASVSNFGSGFTYLYQCGDTYLRDVMMDVPFSVESVVPNPAREELMVRVRQQVSGAVRYELIDGLGRTLPRTTTTRGERETVLNVGSLPSGVYNLRVSQGGFVQSRRIIIER